MSPHPDDRSEGRGPRGLLVVLLVGPVVWFAHLNISYALVYATCRPWGSWWLHLVTAVALSVIGALTADEVRRRKRTTGLIDQISGSAIPGWQFVATMAWMLGVFFLVVTAMAGLASAVVDPCL